MQVRSSPLETIHFGEVGEVVLSALPARLFMHDSLQPTSAWTVDGVTLLQATSAWTVEGVTLFQPTSAWTVEGVTLFQP